MSASAGDIADMGRVKSPVHPVGSALPSVRGPCGRWVPGRMGFLEFYGMQLGWLWILPPARIMLELEYAGSALSEMVSLPAPGSPASLMVTVKVAGTPPLFQV